MGLDRPFNPHQKLLGHLAGGAAQVVQDGGGGEFHDTGKVPILQIVGRVQAVNSCLAQAEELVLAEIVYK